MQFTLSASVCWFSGALASSIILNANNFTSVKKGTWFVKFYAPWCRHSKALAPEWVKLSDKLEHLKEKKFYFGEVDCDSNSHICSKHKVDGYPTLLLFHKGKLIEEFDQNTVAKLTVGSISPYVFKKVKKYAKTPKEPTPKAIPPTMPREPLDSGFVVEIDPKSFLSIANSSNPWAVLFYSPTCPHCRAMEPLYIDAALKSKNRLNFAKIDCLEFSDFCQDKLVAGVPDMRILLQEKQLAQNIGEFPMSKLLQFVQKYYVPKTSKMPLHELQSKIEHQTASIPTKPFLVLASDSTATDHDFKGIISNLVGAGLKDEIMLVEDRKAPNKLQLKSSPVALFFVHGSQVIEFTHPLGPADVLRTWAASTGFPLANELQHKFISESALADYHLIVGIPLESPERDSARLKELTLQSNINYLQTIGQAPLMANTSLLKPVLFTYIDGPIEAAQQKQLLSDLKIPFGEVQKHAQEGSSDYLFVLIDASAGKYFCLNSKAQMHASAETLVAQIKDFQEDRLNAHPLAEEQEGTSYAVYFLVVGLLAAVLAWYVKKSKAEPEIHYSRL